MNSRNTRRTRKSPPGSAPAADWGIADNPTTIRYFPGPTGWRTTFSGRPTALWVRPEPTILNPDSRFGPKANGFGFVTSWAARATIVVDASPTLTNPTWFPVSTSMLVNGTAQFTEPDWMNHPSRFYRVRQP